MDIENICKLKDLNRSEMIKILEPMLNDFSSVASKSGELYLERVNEILMENDFIGMILSENDNTIYYIFDMEDRTIAMTFESILDIWYGFFKMLLDSTGKDSAFKNTSELRVENIYNYIKELNEKRKER